MYEKAGLDVARIPELLTKYGGAFKMYPGPVPKFDYILQSERGKKTFNFKPEEIFRQLRGLFSDMKSIRLQGHSTEKQESKEV